MKRHLRLVSPIVLLLTFAIVVIGKSLGWFASAPPLPPEMKGLELLLNIALGMLGAVVLSELFRLAGEADDRKTIDSLDARFAAIERQVQVKFEVVPFPEKPEQYRELWANFTGVYYAYNPAFEVERNPGLSVRELIDELFVPRYKNAAFVRAHYLFLTGDENGTQSLAQFKDMMRQVRARHPRVVDKVVVRVLPTKAAIHEAEVYRGTQAARETALVEMTHGGLTGGRGRPFYYLRVHDAGALGSLRRQFDAEWQQAGKDLDDFWTDRTSSGVAGGVVNPAS